MRPVVADSVLDVRHQPLVDAVQPVGIERQCLPNVRDALRFQLFKFVEVLHIVDVRCYLRFLIAFQALKNSVPCSSPNAPIMAFSFSLSRHLRQYGWLGMSGSIIGQNATACFPQMIHLQSDALVMILVNDKLVIFFHSLTKP